jgi:hypothetical protein
MALKTDAAAAWHDAPLREGEYDVPVMFRVTATSDLAAHALVQRIVETDPRLERNIVSMYVP